MAQMVENLPAVQDNWVQPLGWKRESPGKGNGNPLYYSCLEISIERGALAGYSLWGRKESDTIEPPTLSLFSTVHEIIQDSHQKKLY